MSKSQASRRKSATDAKQKEMVELLASMGRTQLSDGREISSLKLNELQGLLKYGVKKNS